MPDRDPTASEYRRCSGLKNVFLGIIESAASALRRCNRYILGYSDAVIGYTFS
jgi:hypothetical protein